MIGEPLLAGSDQFIKIQLDDLIEITGNDGVSGTPEPLVNSVDSDHEPAPILFTALSLT